MDAAYDKFKVTDPRTLKAALEGLSPEERKAQLTNPEGTPAPPPSRESDAIQALLDQGRQNQNAIRNVAGQLHAQEEPNARFGDSSDDDSSSESEGDGAKRVKPKKLFTPAACNTERSRQQPKQYVAEPSGTSNRPGRGSAGPPAKKSRRVKLDPAPEAKQLGKAMSPGKRKLQTKLDAAEKETKENKKRLASMSTELARLKSQDQADKRINDLEASNSKLMDCIYAIVETATLCAKDEDKVIASLKRCARRYEVELELD